MKSWGQNRVQDLEGYEPNPMTITQGNQTQTTGKTQSKENRTKKAKDVLQVSFWQTKTIMRPGSESERWNSTQEQVIGCEDNKKNSNAFWNVPNWIWGCCDTVLFLQEHKSLILHKRGRDKRWKHNGWIISGRKSLNQCERLVRLSALIPHTFIPSITEPLMDLECWVLKSVCLSLCSVCAYPVNERTKTLS